MDRFIKGMDVSMLRELEDLGASYYIRGEKKDLFRILKECGTNMIRLRIWADPYDAEGMPYGGGMNDLSTTKELAHRAKESGIPYMLDFHYSDFWADPSKQIKPKAWTRLTGEQLRTAVYLHTVDTLKSLKNLELLPEMVQIGNEITKGILWPDGHVDNKAGMAELLKSGIAGVREICPRAKIVLHLDYGTDNRLYREWFDGILPLGIDFDVIGMSYYPHWNGDLASLAANMNDVSSRYGKDVMVVETSIGYTTDTLGCKGVVYSQNEAAASGYPATKDGQEAYLRDLCATIKSVNNHRGIGFCYWEPMWLPILGCAWAKKAGCEYINDSAVLGNTMVNQALFDGNGNANPALLNLINM